MVSRGIWCLVIAAIVINGAALVVALAYAFGRAEVVMLAVCWGVAVGIFVALCAEHVDRRNARGG